MSELYMQYGPSVLTLVVTVLSALLTKLVASKIKYGAVADAANRAVTEVFDAVQEVSQTYVKELRHANEDGVLTKEEREKALSMALATAKANIGTKGVARLGRVLGLSDVDSWLTTKAEAAVATLPKATALPPKQ